MILTYLLSLSILIVSVIKMTDTMLELNRRHEKVKVEFVNKTKSLHNPLANQKGNMTLMGAALAIILSGLLLFFVKKHALELKEANYRKESYLCMAYLNRETENYVRDMAKFNWLFRSLFISLAAGVNVPQVKLVIESTKWIRQSRHLLYLKNLKLNSYCKSSLMSMNYLLHLPYQTNQLVTLKTSLDETTLLGNKTWISFVIKPPIGIRLKNAFCLKTKFQLESVFSSRITKQTSENPMQDLSALNCLSGPPSS